MGWESGFVRRGSRKNHRYGFGQGSPGSLGGPETVRSAGYRLDKDVPIND